MTTDFDKKIEARLETFTKYLTHSKMSHKEYQSEGVKWCLINELNPNPSVNVKGGFIADEMGLGKTIMVIGLMLSNFRPKTLIVLPPVLIEQWFEQILRTTGHKALIYYGENKKKITIDQLNSACIVITSYGGITMTKKQLQENKTTLLHEVKWSRIVFDEAHHLRNKKTKAYISAKLLKSKIRWLVSGTPVQNKRSDFYNLCSILQMPASFYTDPEKMATISREFILKRTKKQVGINLPDIKSINNSVDWQNKKEMELSEQIHSALSFSRVKSRGFNSDEYCTLLLMLRAKQSCILPKLMNESLVKLVKAGVISDYNYFKEALKYSSKIDFVIQTILRRKDNEKGKLIFCHYRDEIDEIAKRLADGGMTNIATFDGRVHNNKRNEIVNEKNNALILQIQTGCEGLNLQENYSEIYFISPHWNPAVEDQAIARCHRIGQKNTVSVFKFQMSSFISEEIDENGLKIDTLTIDKYVNTVQDSKREMANELISN
jgi:SNF2 family DNA or RNA helicase